MTDYMTPEAFAAKIDWEGGVMEALDYGLRSSQLDPADECPVARELRAAWIQAESAWERMRTARDAVDGLLELLEEVPGES